MTKNNLVSIVVPLKNEERNVPVLIEKLRDAMKGLAVPYELILVDDGSTDETFAAISRASAEGSDCVGIRLRRSFGQTTAMQAGFDRAKGNICITLDGDLQHDPADIPKFLEKLGQGFDMVCSYREGRNDGLMRRIPSKFANWLARKLSSVTVRDFGSTFRAYRTDVIREISIHGEMHRFIPVFVSMISSRITEVPIEVKTRLYGKSNYGISRTFRVVSDLIVLLFFSKFFGRPIHIFGYISFALGIPGLLLGSALVVRKLALGVPILANGPLFTLAVSLCLVAVQLLTTGVVCEYLVRILYRRAGTRPYSVGETIEKPDETPTAK